MGMGVFEVIRVDKVFRENVEKRVYNLVVSN